MMAGRVSMRLFNALFLLSVVIVLTVAFSIAERDGVTILLPGTQPGQSDTSVSVENCRACHAQQVREWAGSAEALAARDPVFNAFLSIITKYTGPLGFDADGFCLRCHSPSGWLAGRSHLGSVREMYGSDLDGVHCDFCHRSVDPMHPDSNTIVGGGDVPGYGNGMYVIQTSQMPVRGARGTQHPCCQTVLDPFYRTSEYCGVCHDQGNPYVSEDPRTTPPHLQVPVERTYSEWKLSWYASRGEAGTCQSCHMKRQPGFATSFPPRRYRLDVASHDFSGGNTLAPLATIDAWSEVNGPALLEGVQRSMALHQSAVNLEVSAGRTEDSVIALVRVTNLTGHKLPTGFPEGRLLWIAVTALDRDGSTVFQSGVYDSTSKTFLHDAQVKMYEMVAGMTPRQATSLGQQPGPSFLRPLNDTVYLDNRIPPRGFSNQAFRERRAEPIGYAYNDGQYWDVTRYSMPGNVTSVEVTVYYQVARREFVQFLRDENVGNPYDWNEWGSKVHRAWHSYGGPVPIAQQAAAVQNAPPRLSPVPDPRIPVEVRLAQSYPNPCNAEATIEFWISEPTNASLIVYDAAGREISRLVEGNLSAGLHAARFNASSMASGVYFYRIRADGADQTKKLLILK